MHSYSLILFLAVPALVVASGIIESVNNSISNVTSSTSSSTPDNKTLFSHIYLRPAASELEDPSYLHTSQSETPSAVIALNYHSDLSGAPDDDTANRVGSPIQNPNNALSLAHTHSSDDLGHAIVVRAAPKCAKATLNRRIGYYQV